MKLAVGFVAIMISALSFAENLPKDQIERILIQRFEQVAGGYYVNENCSFIQGDEKTTYIGKLSQVNIYAQKLIGSKIIYSQQKRGKLGANRKPYSNCESEAKNLFEAAKMMTEMFYDDLISTKKT